MGNLLRAVTVENVELMLNSFITGTKANISIASLTRTIRVTTTKVSGHPLRKSITIIAVAQRAQEVCSIEHFCTRVTRTCLHCTRHVSRFLLPGVLTVTADQNSTSVWFNVAKGVRK